jgi:DNA-binding transcriptional ArsR family regulator
MPAITAARAAPVETSARVPLVRPAQAIPATRAFVAVAERLDTVSDRVRLQILWWLGLGDRSVTDLCGLVGMRQQAVTHHLNIMRLRRIVAFRRKGRWNLYYLTDEGRAVMAAAKLLF